MFGETGISKGVKLGNISYKLTPYVDPLLSLLEVCRLDVDEMTCITMPQMPPLARLHTDLALGFSIHALASRGLAHHLDVGDVSRLFSCASTSASRYGQTIDVLREPEVEHILAL